MNISCIVPIYNNAQTLAHVLTTLLQCPSITEIVAVDDASTDQSLHILNDFKKHIRVIARNTNGGKGAAFVSALQHTKYDTILCCDADLSTITPAHIRQLIHTYASKAYAMVIAARETDRGLGYYMGRISGERIFQKRSVLPYLHLIQRCGNGAEQIINYAHRSLPVKMIVSRNIGHQLKYMKPNPIYWFQAYIKEGYQLAHTAMRLRLYR